jgi:hypothetical protein
MPRCSRGSTASQLSKDVAQIAAVIGREFSYPLIAAAAVIAERDLNAALAQLVAAELIYQRGVPPDASYQFFTIRPPFAARAKLEIACSISAASWISTGRNSTLRDCAAA